MAVLLYLVNVIVSQQMSSNPDLHLRKYTSTIWKYTFNQQFVQSHGTDYNEMTHYCYAYST